MSIAGECRSRGPEEQVERLARPVHGTGRAALAVGVAGPFLLAAVSLAAAGLRDAPGPDRRPDRRVGRLYRLRLRQQVLRQRQAVLLLARPGNPADGLRDRRHRRAAGPGGTALAARPAVTAGRRPTEYGARAQRET